MTISEIKERLTAENVAQNYGLRLRKSGKWLVCRCPFHDDKNASFAINSEKNTFTCFSGCGGGDVIELIKAFEGCGTSEALKVAEKMIKGGNAQQHIEERRQKERDICVLSPKFLDEYAEEGQGRESVLKSFLSGIFGKEKTAEAFALYKQGEKEGASIFWKIDEAGRLRAGKVVAYSQDGHRDKFAQPYEIVRALQHDGKVDKAFTPSACLFGAHLLALRPSDPVGVVEAEKTALVCSIVFPGFVWVATGGKTNLSESMVKPLLFRRCLVFPDVDGQTEWAKRCEDLRAKGYDFTISTALYDSLAGWEGFEKADVADVLIELYRRKRRPIEAMAERCQGFAQAVRDFDLIADDEDL